MTTLPLFIPSEPLTMGVELELQLVNTHDYDLVPQAEDLLRRLEGKQRAWEVKPEITSSMIEISTSIHNNFETLAAELREMQQAMVEAANFLNIGIAGGGAHPFQQWSDRRIFDAPRFLYLHELYGYLAKQFTIFGQHVHIGCVDGDVALSLLHSLSAYVPHFIALSASSPFVQGEDTGFQSARLNSVFAFPLSGRAPFATTWDEFQVYFDKMIATGVVESMKDFYWDIRPKPEYGTIELRVCDTPLSIERAAALAVYLQSIARYLLVEQPFQPEEDDYLVYTFNRFQACRFGLEGIVVNPRSKEKRRLGDEILDTLNKIERHAVELKAEAGLKHIHDIVIQGNDATWARKCVQEEGLSMCALMRESAKLWMEP